MNGLNELELLEKIELEDKIKQIKFEIVFTKVKCKNAERGLKKAQRRVDSIKLNIDSCRSFVYNIVSDQIVPVGFYLSGLGLLKNLRTELINANSLVNDFIKTLRTNRTKLLEFENELKVNEYRLSKLGTVSNIEDFR